MARSDLLINLVKAASSGDQRLLRSTVEAIVAEERGKQHNVLADRLQSAMNGVASNVSKSLRPAAVDGADRSREVVVEVNPDRRLGDLLLPEIVRVACGQLVEEQRRADLLRAHSLEPRHRVLLIGPPGNGKTSLAEALADELAVPLLVVRYEGMIGSYLGETAARLKRVFEYARTRPCVLFFDEFDAVGKERGDKHETGEIKRVVTSLLMQIDELPSYTVVAAATNHAELLDRAVWRRFQLRLELPQPGAKEMGEFIDRFLSRLQEPVGMTGLNIAKKLGPVSISEAEQFCLDVMRRHVLSLGSSSLKVSLSEQLKIWSARVSAVGNNKIETNRANSTTAKTSAARGR
ncbi:AAA family ATPase [Burkholderia pseudomallei]|uniref:AAA family ATPase n=2 Tax=Burkholderia pseudomallei TaxID=28450 RepID=UPI00050E1CDC|nr:ATP-binding protein [Burkholderia pseudomallei]AIV53529.1 AAA domain family protein [Burkholderia pseudomallei MSHR1153]AJX68763.1 AAA domain family protein [Burkholderia pseudomallei MSHR840]AJX73740.1 AAA domain family protein [Burkholderia pseudomallei MSHR2543]KGC29612.1 AAA domain family protein [Burkholderia pseudomallei]KGC58064.1 AAA domain family protein [Burkholderia pseudomallei]